MNATNIVYLPDVDGRFIRNYFFRHPQHGPCSCVLVSDCRSNTSVQYAHVMYVYEQGDFLVGRPCFAVTSEANRTATPGSGRSHFLCVFPGGPQHDNLGAADDWADLEKFAAKALGVVAERFALPGPPQEIAVPTMMLQKFRTPRTYAREDQAAPKAVAETKAKPWWQFW